METSNLESSGPSVPTSSIYFTSILPAPTVPQYEEIQMKDVGHANGNNGVDVVSLGHDHIGYGGLPINNVGSVEDQFARHSLS